MPVAHGPAKQNQANPLIPQIKVQTTPQLICARRDCFVPRKDVLGGFALRIAADTGPWLRPVQYEQKAWPAGNAIIQLAVFSRQFALFTIQPCKLPTANYFPTSSFDIQHSVFDITSKSHLKSHLQTANRPLQTAQKTKIKKPFPHIHFFPYICGLIVAA